MPCSFLCLPMLFFFSLVTSQVVARRSVCQYLSARKMTYLQEYRSENSWCARSPLRVLFRALKEEEEQGPKLSAKHTALRRRAATRRCNTSRDDRNETTHSHGIEVASIPVCRRGPAWAAVAGILSMHRMYLGTSQGETQKVQHMRKVTVTHVHHWCISNR